MEYLWMTSVILARKFKYSEHFFGYFNILVQDSHFSDVSSKLYFLDKNVVLDPVWHKKMYYKI